MTRPLQGLRALLPTPHPILWLLSLNERMFSNIKGGIAITGGNFYNTTSQFSKDPREGQLSSHQSISRLTIPVIEDLFENYVVTSAMHDNDEQVAAAECHPNTRVALLERLEIWATGLRGVYDGRSALWVHGSAGIGKTAIARSLARLLETLGSPVASFFCFSTDSQRNTIKTMIPTIAYQIALAVPATQPFIINAVAKERKIFHRSARTQLQRLIVNPLLQLLSTLENHDTFAPILILIDGLDEINRDSMERRELLDIIRSFLPSLKGRAKFFVTSRAEHDIETAFDHPDFTEHLSRLNLRRDLDSYRDIHTFLRDRFAKLRAGHRLKSQLQAWPPEEALRTILFRSSDHFIYATTVMKYIEADYADPRRRLDDILRLSSTSQNPYSDLDAVYHQVLTNVRSEYDVVQNVLRFTLASTAVESNPGRIIRSTAFIESLLFVGEGYVSLALLDLQSLVELTTPDFHDGLVTVELLHKSFADYLLDKARSGKFYIDVNLVWPYIVKQIHRFLSELFENM